jgi:cyclic pyranopterin phosphate synthase
MTMIDPHGRPIDYLRLSLTDRCNLRCGYCLPEHALFAPRANQLTIDELDRLASAFIRLGVTKLRLTGGEPLVRKGVMDLVWRLSRHLRSGALREMTLTTNGTQLAAYAAGLAEAGVKRINVSLDHLDPSAFARITRGGQISHVLAGIEAALGAGLRIKINTVVLRDDNFDEIVGLVFWAHRNRLEITLIEVMPMGEIGADRLGQHVAMPEVRARIEERWTLTDISLRTGGPARYATTPQGGIIGFITPLSANFCDGCNRVRVSADGQLHACLGRDVSADLKAPLRAARGDRELEAAIRSLIAIKPAGHDFKIARGAGPAVSRPMAVTGG